MGYFIEVLDLNINQCRNVISDLKFNSSDSRLVSRLRCEIYGIVDRKKSKWFIR